MTDLSVCFGTYNRLGMLRHCIDSIRLAAGNLSYEIVITDGGSDDGTLEYLHAQPDVLVIEHGKLRGAVKAYQDAVLAASGEYVCYLSDDLIMSPGMLSAAVEYLKQRPLCGVVGLQYRNTGGPKTAINMARVEGVSYPFASYGVMRRADGNHVGWFPPKLYHYFLDVSICIKMLHIGKTIEALPGDYCIQHFGADNIIRGPQKSRTYSKKQEDAAFIEFVRGLHDK